MSAPVPFRLKALKKLTECIQRVTPANGYTNDLSDAVFRGRLAYGDDEVIPMVSLIEPPLAIESLKAQADNISRNGDWDILVQGWVEDDRENPTDPAYLLAAEVTMELAVEKQRKRGRTPDILGLGAGFGDEPNGITGMTIGAPVVRPPDETSARACFYILLTLQIAEDTSRPFG